MARKWAEKLKYRQIQYACMIDKLLFTGLLILVIVAVVYFLSR